MQPGKPRHISIKFSEAMTTRETTCPSCLRENELIKGPTTWYVNLLIWIQDCWKANSSNNSWYCGIIFDRVQEVKEVSGRGLREDEAGLRMGVLGEKDLRQVFNRITFTRRIGIRTKQLDDGNVTFVREYGKEYRRQDTDLGQTFQTRRELIHDKYMKDLAAAEQSAIEMKRSNKEALVDLGAGPSNLPDLSQAFFGQ